MTRFRPRLVPLEPRHTPAGGLTAGYYTARDFSGSPAVRIDPAVEFDWSADPATVPTAVRWQGTVTAPTAGSYTFRTVAGGGVRLWVGGQLVVDDAGGRLGAANSPAYPLTTGQAVPVELEFTPAARRPMIALQWLLPGPSPYTPVPTEGLTPAAPDLARSRPATASTGAAGRAVDGVRSTAWESAAGDPAAWYQVDLGTPTRLGTVELVSRQDRTDQASARRNFELRASTTPDFASYAVLGSQGATAFPLRGTWTAAVTDPTTYRYLRAVKTDGTAFSLAELRATAPPPAYTPLAGGSLGGTAADDVVTGSAIQADGSVVLAGRVGGSPGGLAPTLLNGATATTPGAVVRLTADGRTVLSVTRLAATVTDLSMDSAGNLYVAAGAGGLFKLDPTAGAVLWSKPAAAYRVDAGADGDVAALTGSGFSTDGTNFANPNTGTVTVYNAAGTQVGNFSTLAGRGCYDVALDGGRDSVFTTGFLQTSGNGQPVQIAYLRAQAYDGSQKWLDYNWGGAQVDGVGETNNMADTRGLRLDLGDDGKLYAAFQAAGGNHIFRYSPHDVLTPVSLVGGDFYHDFYNTASEHKTVFGRYDPDNGDLLLGQQFCTRLPNGKGNTVYLGPGGDIQADASGRVYIAGASAYGLPLSFDPLPANTYTGGSFLLVMSSDFRTRLLCTRPNAGGAMMTVAARVLPGETDARVAAAGKGGTGGWTTWGVQSAYGGGTADGHYLVLGPGAADLGWRRPVETGDGSDPSAVADGDPATAWHSTANDNQYLMVDLGSSRTVTGVAVTFGANFAKKWRVQVLDDANVWRDVWATTAGTGGAVTVRAGGVGRFVRVLLDTRNSAATGFDVLDLAVLGE